MDAIQGNCGREKSWSPRGHVESASWANTDSVLSPLRLAGLAFFVGVDKVIATLDLLSCSKEQIAKDLLSGEEEEETQSSADDLTPSVTSHEASDLFHNQSGYSVTVTNIAAVCHLGLHAQPQLGALPGRCYGGPGWGWGLLCGLPSKPLEGPTVLWWVPLLPLSLQLGSWLVIMAQALRSPPTLRRTRFLPTSARRCGAVLPRASRMGGATVCLDLGCVSAGDD